MGRYVMVVDDDKGIIDVTTIVLLEKGYVVESITDAKKIFSRINKGKPGVILLDLNMPGMSGEEVLKRLKSSPKTKNIPVIIMSGSIDIELVVEKIGTEGYLSKPFDITQLEEIVDKYLTM